jgi:mannose-1-phosphate guanylyltransferase
MPADKAGNAASAATLIAVRGAKGNLAVAKKGKVVAIVGLSDIAVIDTDDALLVCPLADAQAVREVAMALRADRHLSKLA